jgi:hypothetical protein
MIIQSVANYREFDPSTNPGDYIYLYNDLPKALESLCDLVQYQLVHPWNGGPQPQGRHYEPRNNHRVQDMLGQLVQMNSAGLVIDRLLDERVIASCRENALLLTSILRYQGIPSRVRAGWVKYLSSDPSKFTDHWVSEVWREEEKRWLLVDTNPKRIDFPRSEFQSGGATWLQLRAEQATPEAYRMDDNLFYVKLNFGHDFNAVLGTGPHYWEAPSLFHIKMKEMEDWQLALLDQIAKLLEKPDRNLGKLQQLQLEHDVLQGLESAWPIFERTVYG